LILTTIFANCVALAVYTPYPEGDSNELNTILVGSACSNVSTNQAASSLVSTGCMGGDVLIPPITDGISTVDRRPSLVRLSKIDFAPRAPVTGLVFRRCPNSFDRCRYWRPMPSHGSASGSPTKFVRATADRQKAPSDKEHKEPEILQDFTDSFLYFFLQFLRL
jgi:hypothetical protein